MTQRTEDPPATLTCGHCGRVHRVYDLSPQEAITLRGGGPCPLSDCPAVPCFLCRRPVGKSEQDGLCESCAQTMDCDGHAPHFAPEPF